MKAALKKLVATLAGVPAISSAAYQIHRFSRQKGTYPYYRDLFINNGRNSKFDTSVRAEMVSRFEAIHNRVRYASSPTDGLVLAEALLSMDAEGDIVECGCFAGASSAKLSIVAQAMGKKLIVCDSFEGL